jgi:hypothetical protein
MYWDPSRVFDAVAGCLSDELVPAEQVERCRRVAASLPKVTTSYYLECRLDDDAQVDFLALVKNRSARQEFERNLGPAVSVRCWRRTLQLLEAWQDVSSVVRHTPFVWLEYDIDKNFQADAPMASPGFCLEPKYFSRFSRDPVIDRDLAFGIGQAGLHHLLDGDDLRSNVDWVKRCIARLPAGGSLIHVSAMLARSPERMKLYVAMSKVAVYLAQIGWPGSLSHVREILEAWYCDIPNTVFLDLTMLDGPTGCLGFAFSQMHCSEMAAFDPTWRQLPMSKISETKRRATWAWPGVTELALDGERTWLYRWLDIKLVMDTSGGTRCKAYLGFMPALPPLFA